MDYFSAIKQKLLPAYIGIDIGTTSMKVVEVKQGKQLPLVTNYGILELSGHLTHGNKVIQTSGLKIFEDEALEMLTALLRQMKPSAKAVIAALPAFSIFTTVLDFPQMDASEMQKAMVYQARQYIPMPITEVSLDYIKVGEYEDDKGFKHQQVLLVSVPRDIIEKYKSLFKKAGLELASLEIESLALVRSVIYGDRTPTIVVDIGSRSTNIVFSVGGQLTFASQSDFASASLTQALSSSLNINPLRAEQLKIERGILAVGANFELSTIMMPYVDVIISEVKKAHYNYAQQFPAAAKIERIIVAGGGANLLGLTEYMQQQMQMPVVKAAPFLHFEYPPSIEPLIPELSPLLSVSMGLALREFV